MKNFRWLSQFKNRATNEEILENIEDGVSLNISDLFILMCAIIIACVGLNMNAAAVIIGAMLISPIMGPIIGIGYGVGIYDLDYIKKAAKLLFFEVSISVITATIYFKLSPITGASSQIISRTSPTIWDVIIAFVGGIAGMIGISRKKAGNVLPGVAIATALMPPLCTVGYGLARMNPKIFLGAGYLFIINSFFIGISTLIIVKLLKIPKHVFLDEKREKKIKTTLIIASVIVVIPSIISAVNMINDSIETNNLNNFVNTEIPTSSYVMEKNINEESKTIDLVLIGTPINQNQIQNLDNMLPKYGFSGYKVNITQSSDMNLKDYFEKINTQNNGLLNENNSSSQTVDSTNNDSKLNINNNKAQNYDKIINQLQALFPDISKIAIGQGVVHYDTQIEASNDEKNDIVPTKVEETNKNTNLNDASEKNNEVSTNKEATDKTKENSIQNTENNSVLLVQIDTTNSKLLNEKNNIENYFKVSTGNKNVIVSIEIISSQDKTN